MYIVLAEDNNNSLRKTWWESACPADHGWEANKIVSFPKQKTQWKIVKIIPA